jgi:2,4-dienoyl-CoA reductase (NADPH2)
MSTDPIFQPLKVGPLTVKNRLFRSNITGRFDNYDGSGSQARINWEEKFARGGVGAILSSFVPIHVRGRVQPDYAMIDADDKIPFWRQVGEVVHRHDCKYILQISHAGRQRDLPGVENFMSPGLSASGQTDPFHGLPCEAMSEAQIQEVIGQFAAAARRARQAGLDGIELHACHGYLFTQFLSSATNDRKDEWGGPLRQRARFLLEVIAAIRKEVGRDFFLSVKTNAADFNDALFPWAKPGNDLGESIQVCKWVEEAGADMLHVSVGSIFPHPLIPPGGLPPDEMNWWYGIMSNSGTRSFLNYALFHFPPLRPLFLGLWDRMKKQFPIEGVCVALAKEVKQAVSIPVICTGGFQDGRLIRRVIADGWVDGVSIARPLVANNDLPHVLASGKDLPDRPCTFCNRCLINAVANPLGCYDVSRYGGDQEAMIAEVLSVFRPPHFPGEPATPHPRRALPLAPATDEGVYIVEAADGTRTYPVRRTPVERMQRRFWTRLFIGLIAVVAVIAALVSLLH